MSPAALAQNPEAVLGASILRPLHREELVARLPVRHPAGHSLVVLYGSVQWFCASDVRWHSTGGNDEPAKPTAKPSAVKKPPPKQVRCHTSCLHAAG